MISSILAGYAWDVENPYVKNPSRLGTLAELRVAEGNPVEAIPLYEEAIAILQRYPNNAWASRLLETFTQGLAAISEK